jgi:transposase
MARSDASFALDRWQGAAWRISKQGDPYLRRLLVTGATCVIRYARKKAPGEGGWAKALLARRPARLISVALANKMARIVWVLLVSGNTYRAPVAAVTTA